MKRKGFTLIELLAVIVILAVISLIATPMILGVIETSRKSAAVESVNGILDAADKYLIESMLTGKTKNRFDFPGDESLQYKGTKPESGTLVVTKDGKMSITVKINGYCVRKRFDETTPSIIEEETCEIESSEIGSAEKYKEDILNGADPVLSENLVPVLLSNDGTVKKASIYSEWYNYNKKEWANAVILKDKSITYNDGDVIPESNIDGYFVWVPRYRYEIFDEGNYTSATTVSSKPTESAAQSINIVFESKDTTPSIGSTVGSYLTHPAFTSLDVNGLWVAKFETSGTTSDINVLPNVTSLRSINVKKMFDIAYNYDRSSDSHMMKNSEWGAVAYLSHSKYGINEEIRINNSSTYTTGCAATTPALNYVNKEQTKHTEGSYAGCENAYNSSIGYLASTTGNITGIYDISGGAWEYMASYMDGVYGSSGFNATSISSYDSKYFDIYPSNSAKTSYNNRILGDATGELGPFYDYTDSDGESRYHSIWYADYARFVASNYPWFARGGSYNSGMIAGAFGFYRNTGESISNYSFRLVLTF